MWLDEGKFSKYSALSREYCVAEFINSVGVPSGTHLKIRISADARYRLYINGKFIGRGPTTAGSDYLQQKLTHFFIDEYDYISNGNVDIRILATSVPSVMCEASFGQSGVYFEMLDEKNAPICIDKEWLARPMSSCQGPAYTDYTAPEYEFGKACEVSDIYNAKISPLLPLEENDIFPTSLDEITLNSTTGKAIFDKIYSAYPVISLKTDGKVRVKLTCEEIDGVGTFVEEFVADADIIHTSPRMRSVGQMTIAIENISATSAKIDSAYIVYSAYPVINEATFYCDDELLNRIYNLCMHTLKICRKDLHLDSPTHQEPLACTGDYLIQSLMEYVNIYDPTLTALDIYRTSQILKVQDGKMFHTTYSLLFPEWLYDYYMYTADTVLVKECEEALKLLLDRFDTYMGGNGLVEGAPDYMFVDWILMDENGNHTDPENVMSHGGFEGYSLHHPPKALGQSALCMFYYNALTKCAGLYDVIGKPKNADLCRKKAQKLKNSINKHLYDKKRGLYVGGLNTPNVAPDSQWLPENTDKVFYLKQANTLAVLYGIAPENEGGRILKYVIDDLKKEEMQPYFYHFFLEALLKENMFDPYGMELIRRYESLLEKCDKGLCEAWEMFPSDCSHAWGGTPAYMLKKAICGFEMLEPGYKKIKIKPWIFDLDYIYVAFPTPYGLIEIRINENGFTYDAPKEIEVETESYNG